MIKVILFSALFFLFAVSASAQEEQKVQDLIASLFEGMKTKDPGLIQDAFHPEAIMHTVATGEEGSILGGNSVADFVNRIATTPDTTILDERILDFQIKVDGDMASAWTPYEFYVNDGFSHCGVNSFQLIKTGGQWKITYIIDTRRKTGC
jgi:hypothetical protein